MKRANTFNVNPVSQQDTELLKRVLDASAALWNTINYERLMRYNNEDEYKNEGVWDVNTSELEDRYKQIIGKSTAQTIRNKNTEAWKGFFRTKEQFHDKSNTSVTKHPEPPGFRGNKDEGRVLKTVIRNDAYTVEWGERSRLEIIVGKQLKDEYGIGYRERFQVEISGNPNWTKYESQSRLELWYDDATDTFKASQPVTVSDGQQDSPLADETAALDIGANNLVACTTTTGEQYLYEGRDVFQKFRETTEHIAELQSKLEDGQYTSKRIQRLYKKRSGCRNHAQEALCRDLLERLYEEGVSTVYVGDLTDVLETHWSPEVNEKTHQFWAFKKFTKRLNCTAEEYGIEIIVQSEAWTSQLCPDCGNIKSTTRDGDELSCECGFIGHADLTASRNFLEEQTKTEVRLMAQPVRFKWDTHNWVEISDSRESPNEQRTNWSTTTYSGNIASGD